MNAPDRLLAWSDANQRLLAAEFAWLAALLGDGTRDASAAQAEAAALRAAMPAPAAIDTLAALFSLSAFERDLLLLAAGVEMDARIAGLCAQAGGQAHRPWASFGLALSVLPEPHWSAIAPVEPLRRWRLLDVDDSAGIASGRLRVEERVLHFVAGLNALDHRLQPLLRLQPPAGAMGSDQQAAVAQLLGRLRGATSALPAIVLDGDDPAGQRDVAAAVAHGLGAGLYRLDAADVPTGAVEQAPFAALWRREAALLGCGLLIDCEERESQRVVARLMERLGGLVFVSGHELALGHTPQLRQRIARPEAPERLQLWQAALGGKAAALGPVVEALATQYRLGAHRINQIAAQAQGHDEAADAAALHEASRGTAHGMPGLAQRIDTRAGWSDLVLPEAQLAVLRQIAAHARHRLKVHHEWGFADQGARGLGIATLFWGDSGTGKTLAAEVIASWLGLALYRIDLSAVVSKYIGETEKNLRKVFDAAEEAGAILLFDEADALFGKRSEVKDSHDRYANIEVSYLLQRMESYGGLAILTTNHKAALDSAFQRRLRFVVHFPFPDQVQREAIWRTVFPAGVPLDAGIDHARLARLNVAGGTIRNIALGAAFLAAEADTPIGMATLLQAAQLDAAKRDKPCSDAETRGWV
ncbi:ATP-binding protein [Variovorax sp. OV329]|uniref:AAA family ATPase n=1 Tax=Variovorax sp. OV329 TaxID=1882825 RepID=UPI0008EF3E44|nr:ATP-binding protein [Variovorax sp. OV329]SFL96484.1 ATPase family associated with various cellular activities (AAA) [Variovorax sp. OV329]